jgi:hypothetical protein
MCKSIRLASGSDHRHFVVEDIQHPRVFVVAAVRFGQYASMLQTPHEKS